MGDILPRLLTAAETVHPGAECQSALRDKGVQAHASTLTVPGAAARVAFSCSSPAAAMKSGFAALTVLLCAAALPADAAENLPLWAVGVVVGAGYVPQYPASDQDSFRILPLPYFTYRGEVFRSDDKGILRGRILYSDRVELDVSLAGALDVASGDSRARTGMPDLDWMGQVGPRLEVVLARAARDAHVDFELPVRAVLSTDFRSFDYLGLLVAPEIAYQHDKLGGARVKLGLSATFAGRALQEEFYGVPAAYATAARPEYRARSGYLGSKLQLSFTRRVSAAVRLVGAARVDFHGSAANEDSPLFLRRTTGSVGFVVVWTPLRSAATVRE